MTRIAREYTDLITRSTLATKYSIRALQAVAETNDHHAKEILQAINGAILSQHPEKKEALKLLLTALQGHPAYAAPQPAPKSRPEKRPHPKEHPENGNTNPENANGNPENAKKKKSLPKEGFFPFPPEFLLFKMVDKQAYAESYRYYTKSAHEERTESTEPLLTRDYLTTPRLPLAVKTLYASSAQCKVCGMRFASIELFSVHDEHHQRRSQIDKKLSGAMWRPWLLEASQWAAAQKKAAPVSLKSMHHGKIENVPVKGDRSQRCTICKDPFEIIWSDEEECWSFKDALVVKTSPTRQICHRRCAT
ncbi:hypothetical protein NEDG_00743 [Nematocida displodere]|uniref:C2H2-type domain-containing protein n=1 Tax=Nematocida displodere TaxID=1805483 RepID=A0A177EDY3_9MICR|nr:hypothetical protein NEDG_00743 [Nematocida displodere]